MLLQENPNAEMYSIRLVQTLIYQQILSALCTGLKVTTAYYFFYSQQSIIKHSFYKQQCLSIRLANEFVQMSNNQAQNNLKPSGSPNSSNNFCQLFVDEFSEGKQKHHQNIYSYDRYQYQPPQISQKVSIINQSEHYNYFQPFILKKIDKNQEGSGISVKKSIYEDDPFIIIKNHRTSKDTPMIVCLKKQLEDKGPTGFTMKCSIILKFLVGLQKYQNKHWKISELVQQLYDALHSLDQKQIPRRTLGRRIYQCLSIFRSIGVMRKVDKSYIYLKQSHEALIAIEKQQHLGSCIQELKNKESYLVGIRRQLEGCKSIRQRNLIQEKQLKEKIVGETKRLNQKPKYSFPMMIFYGKKPEAKIGVESLRNEDEVQECLILTGSYRMLSGLHACALLKLHQ